MEVRHRRLLIDPGLIVELLKPGTHLYEIVNHALPEDVRLVRFWRTNRNEVGLILESAEFAPIDAFELPPLLDVPAIRHVRGEVIAVDQLPHRDPPGMN